MHPSSRYLDRNCLMTIFSVKTYDRAQRWAPKWVTQPRQTPREKICSIGASGYHTQTMNSLFRIELRSKHRFLQK